MKNKLKRAAALSAAAAMVLMLFSGCGSAGHQYTSPAEEAEAEAAAESSSSSGGTQTEQTTEESTDTGISGSPSGTPFSQISYTRYDTTGFYALEQQIREEMNDEANAESVYTAFSDLISMEYSAQTMYYLAELYADENIYDDSLEEEFTQADLILTEMQDASDTLGHDILSSACGSAAADYWLQSDIDYYTGYEAMSDELAELYTRETELIQDYYDAIAVDYTVSWNGREYTADELYDDSSISNDDYYRLYEELMENISDQVGPIFVELVQVRQGIAEALGYASYADYCYETEYSRDYSTEEALAFDEECGGVFTDVLNDLYDSIDWNAKYRADDEVLSMSVEEELDTIAPFLAQVSPVLTDTLTFMRENGLYDVEYSENRRSGCYTIWLDDYSEPFLYVQPEYGLYDFESIVHEFGHFNADLTGTGVDAGYDLSEVHSQALEVLFSDYYEEVFDTDTAKAAKAYTVYEIGASVTDGCLYDEFQQKVYALDDVTLDAINDTFESVSAKYGYSSTYRYDWLYNTHTFDSPMYYISYAVSALEALQVWQLAQSDRSGAYELYMQLTQADDSDGFTAAMESAGLVSPLGADGAAMMEEVAAAIASLAGKR